VRATICLVAETQDILGDIREGTSFRIGDARFEVSAVDLGDPRARHPDKVRLTFHRNGGYLLLEYGAYSTGAILTEQQAALVGALLRPRYGLKAGDFVEEEELEARVWPRRIVGYKALDIAVHRLRQRLTASGLPGEKLVDRRLRGKSLRFFVSPTTEVIVC
jgi:hypothetical protein